MDIAVAVTMTKERFLIYINSIATFRKSKIMKISLGSKKYTRGIPVKIPGHKVPWQNVTEIGNISGLDPDNFEEGW